MTAETVLSLHSLGYGPGGPGSHPSRGKSLPLLWKISRPVPEPIQSPVLGVCGLLTQDKVPRGNFFIITNLIHKFLVHSHKLYKIKFLYMFRAQFAHHQGSTTQTVHMQPLVSSLSASDRLVQPLRKDFLSGCTRRSLAENEDTRGCICTVCVVDPLMMSGLRSKHLEEFNFM